MTTCPFCHRRIHEGKCCERCGRELPVETPRTSYGEAKTVSDATRSDNSDFAAHDAWVNEKISENDMKTDRRAEACRTPPPKSSPGSKTSLYMDRLGLLLENATGSVRFQLVPGAGEILRNVELKLSCDLLDQVVCSRMPCVDDETGLSQHERRMGNLLIGFPKMEAGSYVWDVNLSFIQNGLRRIFVSQFELVVMRPQNARAVAEQIVFNINNDIRADGAADVHVSNRIADELRESLRGSGENAFVTLQRIVNGRDRAWGYMRLYDDAGRSSLPPCPPQGKTDILKLDFGNRCLKLFANRIVTLGRGMSSSIVIEPPANCTDWHPYERLSRGHCTFEHQGDCLVIKDGTMDDRRMPQPSSHGTFWNNVRIGQRVELRVGERGVLSAAGCDSRKGVSFDVRAVSPSLACASCPYSDRNWCGNGRPSLVLKRTDGLPETYVCMWSCLNLGEIDRSFEGVVIFRKEGAFAWCRGAECGWLVPDTTIQTDYGQLKVTTGLEDKE